MDLETDVYVLVRRSRTREMIYKLKRHKTLKGTAYKYLALEVFNVRAFIEEANLNVQMSKTDFFVLAGSPYGLGVHAVAYDKQA